MGVQIPLIPIQNYLDDLVINEKVFSGTGELYVPFSMFNINKEMTLRSYLSDDEFVFASLNPLFDDYIWIFYVKTANLISRKWEDRSNGVYPQGGLLATAGEFTFYFSKVSTPWITGKLNLANKTMPYNYPTNQARTGKIAGVELTKLYNNKSLISFDNYDDNFISEGVLRTKLIERYHQLLGGK